MVESMSSLDLATRQVRGPSPWALWATVLAGLASVASTVILAMRSDELVRPGLQAFLVNWITVPYLIGGVLAWCEVTPEKRLLTEDAEGIGRDRRPRYPLGRVVGVADVHLQGPERGQPRERPCLGAPVLELHDAGEPLSLSRPVVSRVARKTISSGRSNGRPRMSTAFTKVNTVVLTPMPSPSATAATVVNHGSLRSMRRA